MKFELSFENILKLSSSPWQYPNLTHFSASKTLFSYQQDALKNFIAALYLYFSKYTGETEEEKSINAKKELFKEYRLAGLPENAFSVPKYVSKKAAENFQVNPRFKFFADYFEVEEPDSSNPYIAGYNFINRMAFWMATGSGKSLVLIKVIEILDYLQEAQLIPKRQILLLLPREDLITQFEKLIEDYNQSAPKQIKFKNLKEYLNSPQLHLLSSSEILVYYYRSDLVRTDKAEKILDYRDFDNNGEWYLFLDEAHKGAKDESKAQDIFTILSRNGFLFNFSATFIDEIDRVTTVFNFNLERFITEGYGKNIYLAPSNFKFKPNADDFTKLEKQKQVLKTLLTYTLIKESRKNPQYYHDPLMITLVNSVNTEDSDLLLFFKELDKIATGKIYPGIFKAAKRELMEEFANHKDYVFGNEKLTIKIENIDKLTVKDVLGNVFNAKTPGKIEFLEGEKGKELVLKLETAEKPFGLIKIGDTNKFKKEKLGIDYNVIESFETKKYFEHINEKPEITLLLGSRSFYEGWDSNRPNVINMINIGKGDAKKFVLQGIGRGVRIEPKKYKDPELSRKRLPPGDPDKNILLETLFIYATDKKSVETILKELENQRTEKNAVEIGDLFEVSQPGFDLLIPTYKKVKTKITSTRFNINPTTKERFIAYLKNIDPNVLLVRYGITKNELELILSDEFYQINPKNIYSNLEYLLRLVVNHLRTKVSVVDKIKPLEDEIIHFKHIKVFNLNDEEIGDLKKELEQVKKLGKLTLNKNANDAILLLRDSGVPIDELTMRKLRDLNLKIKYIAKHYYNPVIYSLDAKVEYINHIIKHPSEVRFIEDLEDFTKRNYIGNTVNWLFSKIDESTDSIYIPYYDPVNNIERKFFPDFIFWIQKDTTYEIVFVDPKGTSQSSYQSKIDGFERLFLNPDGSSKVFKYGKFNITFDLKLVGEDINRVGEKYRKYWLNVGDFSFLT